MNINRFTSTIVQYYNIIPVLIGNGFNHLCIITHVSVITYFIIREIVYYFPIFHIINLKRGGGDNYPVPSVK